MAAEKDYSGQSFITPTHKDTYPLISPQKLNLTGKTVFVTGASKGIGRALAIAYAQAGASNIAIGARSDLASLEPEMLAAAKEAGRPAPHVLRISLDVCDLASTIAAAKAIEDTFGRLDILINNAGYLAPFEKITEGDPEEWWKSWEVNVKGVYFLKRATIPLLLKTSDGDKTIVNLSSVGAHRIRPGATNYQPAKLAVCRLAEFACIEYGDQGLLVYSVHPGGVATGLALTMPSAVHSMLVDTPQLASDSMVWLTSERREWLAGRYVSCNWDMGELLKQKERIVKDDLLKVKLMI